MDHSQRITDFCQQAYDLHVHCSPSLFKRRGDANALVKRCVAAGMKGVAVKFHHGSSVEVANVLDQQTPDFRVLGGLVLNQFCGGINPHAVDAAVSLGTAFIWLPTIHAQAHAEKLGVLGGFKFQMPNLKMPIKNSIRLIDSSQRLIPQMEEVLTVLHGAKTVLATGHVSTEEIRAVKKSIKDRKLNVKVLIQHVFFNVPRLTVEELKEMDDDQTWFESTYLTISPQIKANDIAHTSQVILKNNRLKWIFSSDSGNPSLPESPDAIRLFSELLCTNGIPEERVAYALQKEPVHLLDR